MLPNEILPAITRQKVKHIESGEVFNVIAPNPEDNDWIMVLTQDGYKDEVLAKNCQPVPEEPRPFRVGDKVCVMREGLTFTTVDCVAKDFVSVVSGGRWGSSFGVGGAYDLSYLRHATPSEVAQYFN